RRASVEERPRQVDLPPRAVPLVLVQCGRRARLFLRHRSARAMDVDRPHEPHRAHQDVVAAGAERRCAERGGGAVSGTGGAGAVRGLCETRTFAREVGPGWSAASTPGMTPAVPRKL